jgi:hypothetical protein
MRNFVKGDRVRQANYGPGTLTEVNERHTVIDFDEHGIRTFVTKMVVLESTNEPPPPRAKGARRARSSARPAV